MISRNHGHDILMKRRALAINLTLASLCGILAAPTALGETQETVRPHAILPTRHSPDWGTTLTVVIDGVPHPFLFDTGGGVTIVSPSLVRSIGCRPWGQVTGFRMTGQRMSFQRCDTVHLTIAGQHFIASTASIFDINVLAPHAHTKIAGSIALDLFAGQTITIRPLAEEIVIETIASRRARVRGCQALPLRIVRDAEGVALTADIAVPTAEGTAWMELDTGNLGPIAISKTIAPLFGLTPGRKKTASVTFALAQGITVAGPAWVGDFILDGDIGRSFLCHWDVTLDLASKQAWFRPASATKTMAE
jgi:hypothetical protein